MSEIPAFLEGIGRWDYQEAHRQVSMLGEASNITSEDLIKLLQCLPNVVTGYSDIYTVNVGKEVLIWKNYEGLVWALGESFRQILKRKKSLRHSNECWALVENVCLYSQFGKGRESFTMLLGQYGGQDRIPTLLKLLDDGEVQGHALYALRLLGARQARAEAEGLLGSPRSWIRSEARKYLRKCAP